MNNQERSGAAGVGRKWGEMTAPELDRAASAGDVVLLPLGAVEQHGAHLPTDVDIRAALSVATEASRRRPYIIVAPPIWWGLSGAHRGFGGVLTLRHETLLRLLHDLCGSIVDAGFRKIALVVAHGSNRAPVQSFVGEFMQQRGVALLQVNYMPLAAATFQKIRLSPIGGEYHAGEAETALMLHLAPELVHLELAEAHYLDPLEAQGVSFTAKDLFQAGDAVLGWSLKESFPKGVIGDPTKATSETGEAIFEACVSRLCEIVDEYHAL